MTIEEIKKLHSEDEELKKYIDAEADRRVNQAHETWEKKLPAEAEKIANMIMERRDKESAFQDQIKSMFIDSKIPVDLGFDLLGEVGADIPAEELESKIQKIEERYNKITEKVLKEKFGGNRQPRRNISTLEALKPLADASSKEILDNLDQYQERK
ncbi:MULTISPECIES: hypothetical protein [unclassified Oceanispirochaeta]|uniref:hypothetical protein n=1 Tax=unclassified Oceanispirochaeta TaxID=2635722 RepID=UPI000E09B3E2|nr:MULTISPECIES: hypothetical protein [unclassified Oceanispirochaeta]MBF9018957.1 hypothetical protein [Oceanispirochaeta sp. M2]NPD75451.1 hypothetical protein [Oceanispirochaeta sp. M1]RDG28701.1 hypothetical protein DV872_25490 [Oceanispirochaeta sp. M1]